MSDADTAVVPNQFAEDPYAADTMTSARPVGDAYEAYADPGAQHAAYYPGHGGQGMGDTDLLELSATTVATELDMDWDDGDPQTDLRGEAPQPFAAPVGRPSPFASSAASPRGYPSTMPPPVNTAAPYPGNPSPFAAAPPQAPAPYAPASYAPPAYAAPSYAPPVSTEVWEDDEEAATHVMDSPLPAAFRSHPQPPPPIQVEVPSEVSWPDERPARARQAIFGLAAVALIGIAIGVRALLMSPDTATVSLVTDPIDAEVAVDGRPLLGQSSPFTLQGLAADVEHQIEVSKQGFETETARFSLEAGETRTLDAVSLVPVEGTGFALDSVPSDAIVYVDGERIDDRTPVKLVDLEPGLHKIRLELPDGYQPWQTEVALSAGQVIELPVATLVSSSPRVAAGPSAKSGRRGASASGSGKAAAQERAASQRRKAGQGGTASKGTRSAPARRAAARTRKANRANRRASGPSRAEPRRAPKPARAATPRRGSGGATGTFRVNSMPWSQVFVDGRLVGNTPQQNLQLPAGKHRVKLVNPQMGMTKRFSVTVRAGKATTKIVNLIE